MANYWGVGKFGVGLYSASNYVDAAVALAVPFSLTGAALAILVADGAVVWNIPVSIASVNPSVVVFGDVAWSISISATADDVYGGLYWAQLPDTDETWTPIPVDDPSIWVPISDPPQV